MSTNEGRKRKRKQEQILLNEVEQIEMEGLRHDFIEVKQGELQKRKLENKIALDSLEESRKHPSQDLSKYEIPNSEYLKIFDTEQTEVDRDDVFRLVLFWALTHENTGKDIVDAARLFIRLNPSGHYTKDQLHAYGETVRKAMVIGSKMPMAKTPEESKQLEEEFKQLFVEAYENLNPSANTKKQSKPEAD